MFQYLTNETPSAIIKHYLGEVFCASGLRTYHEATFKQHEQDNQSSSSHHVRAVDEYSGEQGELGIDTIK